MTFGEKFDKLVEMKGWSRRQVVAKIGQWDKTVDRWRRDWEHYQPGVEDILAMCRIFEVDAGWLIDPSKGWEDQPAYNSATMTYAQCIQQIARIGPDEALRRLSAGGPQSVSAEPETIRVPEPKPAAPKRRRQS